MSGEQDSEGVAAELPAEVVAAIRAFTAPAAKLINEDLVDRIAAFVTTIAHDAYGRGWTEGHAAGLARSAGANGFIPARFPHLPQLNNAVRHGAVGQG